MENLQETRRTARLLDLVHRIANAPRRWTRKRLAEEYQVSERQITKDLEILKHKLHFELEHAREGYYFARMPRLPTASFSFEEALALLLAVRAGGALAGVDGEALGAAVGRLESLFPRELHPVLRAAEPGAADPGDRAARLADLEVAVGDRRQVWIEYAAASRGGAVTARTIDPYAVFPYGRSWHCAAYCHLRESVRLFKVDRIRDWRVLDSRFPPPTDFDLGRFLGHGWGLMPGVGGPVEAVTLRFHPPAARFVAEERWHLSQRVEWEPGGTMLFGVDVPVTPEFRHWVYHYGRQVEVLAPASLRAWVRAEALAVADRL
ncbi:MAG TPA: WYL domain-containing transcriptional regulator [Thermomicrobiales bacterium]|nr:WYL domain-containing transcriptional regulator [Thermomicrobiales bacterium]